MKKRNLLNLFPTKMSSWEHIVATQIADGAVYPLSRFIDTELHEMETMATLYQVWILNFLL